ncbi:hypothetical protein EOD41_07915 [Mucilaginibacter limnophilus]|uniref:Uncharacterized protein n=1 Tax=Mucilaginibacter limnophilus TaxID=1932778 RepID=A0A3S2Y2E1_9SPHI|nr:hypothetical protein [Mucilaginibacter limnophilus]RVU01873.1 hypothetical protein EOD41_07915 [Mucilaginibacter limnophilus]
MIPEEFYKRRPRHNNTPETTLLIITNFVVFAVATQLFAMCDTINKFYWIVLGCLLLYNFFVISKNREEFDKPRLIAFVLSIVALIGLFFLMRTRAGNC